MPREQLREETRGPVRVELSIAQTETLRNFAKHYGPQSSFPDWWAEIQAALQAALPPESPTS